MSETRVLSTGLQTNDIKKLISKVVTSPVFLVVYTKNRNIYKVSHTLWF